MQIPVYAPGSPELARTPGSPEWWTAKKGAHAATLRPGHDVIVRLKVAGNTNWAGTVVSVAGQDVTVKLVRAETVTLANPLRVQRPWNAADLFGYFGHTGT